MFFFIFECCRISCFLHITDLKSDFLLLREHILYSFNDSKIVEVHFFTQDMTCLCERSMGTRKKYVYFAIARGRGDYVNEN